MTDEVFEGCCTCRAVRQVTTPAVPEFYDRKTHWPAESLERARALRAKSQPAT
jgi:hypothetical protein